MPSIPQNLAWLSDGTVDEFNAVGAQVGTNGAYLAFTDSAQGDGGSAFTYWLAGGGHQGAHGPDGGDPETHDLTVAAASDNASPGDYGGSGGDNIHDEDNDDHAHTPNGTEGDNATGSVTSMTLDAAETTRVGASDQTNAIENRLTSAEIEIWRASGEIAGPTPIKQGMCFFGLIDLATLDNVSKLDAGDYDGKHLRITTGSITPGSPATQVGVSEVMAVIHHDHTGVSLEFGGASGTTDTHSPTTEAGTDGETVHQKNDGHAWSFNDADFTSTSTLDDTGDDLSDTFVADNTVTTKRLGLFRATADIALADGMILLADPASFAGNDEWTMLTITNDGAFAKVDLSSGDGTETAGTPKSVANVGHDHEVGQNTPSGPADLIDGSDSETAASGVGAAALSPIHQITAEENGAAVRTTSASDAAFTRKGADAAGTFDGNADAAPINQTWALFEYAAAGGAELMLLGVGT